MIDPFATHIGNVQIRWENPRLWVEGLSTAMFERGRISRGKERVWFEDRPFPKRGLKYAPTTFPLWGRYGRAPGGFESWSDARQQTYILKRIRHVLKVTVGIMQVWVHTEGYGNETFISILLLKNRLRLRTNLWSEMRSTIRVPPRAQYHIHLFQSAISDVTPHWRIEGQVVGLPDLLNRVLS